MYNHSNIPPEWKWSDERFADLQLLRYRVEGFEALPLRQKRLVYYLSEAALWGRDILWDQNCALNLAARRELEAMYRRPHSQAFDTYMKRVWFSNGIHHHYSGDKFPAPACVTGPLADPAVCPRRVNQRQGDDLLLTSSMNYYAPGIRQAEAEAYYAARKREGREMYGLNSRLERDAKGRLVERVWRSGGMYGHYIDHIVYWLRQALDVAEGESQARVIRLLIDFYLTGDLRTFDRYSIAWVEDTSSQIDFTNGFIEVYGDPLGYKASWEGYVNLTDREATRRTELLAAEAQWFEDHSPVAPQFRKARVCGVSAKVVRAAMLGGDLYPSSAIGINLPNSEWIRAEKGSKSVTIGNLTEAYRAAARGSGLRREFVIDDDTCRLLDRYDDLTDDLHTDLHECLGHGSGQLLAGVSGDALGAYGSTIEEARADLFALYYMASPRLVEMGLLPDADAYRASYYSYMMNGLIVQLARIEEGRDIEEAHMRNRAMIARWCLRRGAMRLEERGGKTFLRILDYERLREDVATLLAEVQRIRSEGDAEAAARLVEDYGVKVDPRLHAEVRSRYASLDIAPYKGFINPEYRPRLDHQGHILDVDIVYGEAFDHQMLRYGHDYC